MKEQTEFYKEIHNSELLRKDEIDASIGFPTTLLTLLIGGGFFLFSDENLNLQQSDNQCLLIVIYIFTLLFLLSIIVTIIFLTRMYLNRFRKYKYLPLSSDLLERENQLLNHFLIHFEKIKAKKPKKKAQKWANLEFQENLLNYYVTFSSNNQLVNDERLKDYYRSRKTLIFSIAFIAIIAILIILK